MRARASAKKNRQGLGLAVFIEFGVLSMRADRLVPPGGEKSRSKGKTRIVAWSGRSAGRRQSSDIRAKDIRCQGHTAETQLAHRCGNFTAQGHTLADFAARRQRCGKFQRKAKFALKTGSERRYW